MPILVWCDCDVSACPPRPSPVSGLRCPPSSHTIVDTDMPSLGQKGKGISSVLNLSALEQFSYDYIILLDQSEWMILHVWLPSPSNIYRCCVTMQSFNFTRYHSKQVGENTLPSSYIFYEALKFLLHFERYIFKHYGRIFSNFPLSWLCPACVAVSSPLCSARSNFQLIISELSNPKIFMTDMYVVSWQILILAVLLYDTLSIHYLLIENCLTKGKRDHARHFTPWPLIGVAAGQKEEEEECVLRSSCEAPGLAWPPPSSSLLTFPSTAARQARAEGWVWRQ